MTWREFVPGFRRLAAFLIDVDANDDRPKGPLPSRVVSERVDLALRMAPLTIITSLLVSEVIVFLSWKRAPDVYLTILGVTAPILAFIALEKCRRWRLQSDLPFVGPVFLRTFEAVALAAGLLLASIPIMLFADSDMQGRVLIAATCAGLIATGMSLATVPRAGFGYVAPIVAGSFLALAMTGERYNIYVALLLLFYSFFIFTAMSHLRRLVTKRVLMQIELARQRELTGLLLNDFEAGASDWLWETDGAFRLQHVSARFAEVSGIPAERLQGMAIDELLLESLGAADDDAAEAGALALLDSMERRLAFREHDLPLPLFGNRRWWTMSGKPIVDCEGHFVGYRGVGSDITDRKRSQEQLSYLATHDPLTGLPNRVLFREQLDRLLSRQPFVGFTVLCLDLDEFKNANDSFGHGVGDALLRAVADRLRSFAGPDLFFARLAGDEFMVLQRTTERGATIRLAEQLVQAISRPYRIGEIQISIGISIGIAMAPWDGTSDIVRRADLALYRMKSEGRNGFRFYEAEMDERVEKRRLLAADLHGALDRGEFALHFQPLVNAETSAIEGFEALLRWSHPVRGSVSPAEFIPLAEETGVLIAIGEWVLHEACRVASGWPSHIGIAVNISPVQLRHSDLPALVGTVLAATGLEPHRLELEVTESVFLDATPATQATLARLRAMKVHLSLDDFGTGYSSLAYLRRIPFDKLKIDRSFVFDLIESETGLSIVEAIISLAKALGISVIAEGVEHRGQQECLAKLGCDQCQGFLFSRPVSEDKIPALLSGLGSGGQGSDRTHAPTRSLLPTS